MAKRPVVYRSTGKWGYLHIHDPVDYTGKILFYATTTPNIKYKKKNMYILHFFIFYFYQAKIETIVYVYV